MDPVIKRTEERLKWLSSDAETRRRYEMRENSRIELNSLLYEREQAGLIRGEHAGVIKVAKEMLQAGMPLETIAALTKLPLSDVQALSKEL